MKSAAGKNPQEKPSQTPIRPPGTHKEWLKCKLVTPAVVEEGDSSESQGDSNNTYYWVVKEKILEII